MTRSAHRPLTAVAAVLVAAPVAVRRRWPALALVTSSVAALVQAPLGGHLTEANGLILPPLLLCYGAGAWAGLRRGVAATAAATACFAALAVTTPTPGSAAQALARIVFASLLCLPAWLVGRIARTPTLRADAFRRLAEQAAADVQAKERSAAAEERVRIGRELQDIVAHSVSAMVVQAGAPARCSPGTPIAPGRRLPASSRPAGRRWQTCAGCSASCGRTTIRRRSRRSRGCPSCKRSSTTRALAGWRATSRPKASRPGSHRASTWSHTA